MNHELEDLLPHRGPALLLDQLLCTSPEETQASASITPSHAYLTTRGVHALIGVELLAQAAALHDAIHKRSTTGVDSQIQHPGVLAGASDLHLTAILVLPVGSLLCVTVRPGSALGTLQEFSGKVERLQEQGRRELVLSGTVQVRAGFRARVGNE